MVHGNLPCIPLLVGELVVPVDFVALDGTGKRGRRDLSLNSTSTCQLLKQVNLVQVPKNHQKRDMHFA